MNTDKTTAKPLFEKIIYSMPLFNKDDGESGGLEQLARAFNLKPEDDITQEALAELIVKAVNEYDNLKTIGRYFKGDVVCYNDNPVAVDNMGVFVIWGGPLDGYYIPKQVFTAP